MICCGDPDREDYRMILVQDRASVQDVVAQAVDEGFHPVPVAPGKKKATAQGWTKKRFEPEDFAAGGNVGLRHDNVAAIDLDCPEALKIAGRFLDPTRTSGRETAPDSHWWYEPVGGTPPYKTFADAEGEVLVELRFGRGHQTLIPPSVHPSGDRYVVGSPMEVAKVDAGDLERQVRMLAAACYIARTLPATGRHFIGQHITGYLIRRESAEDVLRIVKAAWDAAGYGSDPNAQREAHKDLEGFVSGAAAKLEEGAPLTGGKTWKEETGKDHPRNLAKILGWKSSAPETEESGAGWKVSRKGHEVPHTELRDRWRKLHPGHVYSREDWWKYADGYWTKIPSGVVENQILQVLEAAEAEGETKVTAYLLGSVGKLAKTSTFLPSEIWDANPDVQVHPNGTLELSTRTLREHRAEDYVTHALPYEYDPDANAEMFLAVLEGTVPDEAKFIQEYAGYCLTPDCALETALWFHGPPGSGKSTIIDGIIAMLGDRAGVLGLAELERSSFALSKIPGKTLLTATEQPASFVKSTDVLNTLISGEPLQIDRKYREPLEVRSVAKLLWAMNEKPRIGHANSGIFRRVKVVEFPTLDATPDPRVKLIVRTEGAGILNWALEGLERLQGRGYFEIPQSVRDATAEYQEENDPAGRFVAERVEFVEGHEVQASKLYDEYKYWCQDNGFTSLNSTNAAKEWKRLLPGWREGRGRKRFYTGVRLLEVVDL